MHIEVFRINENNHWELEEYNNADSIVEIKAIGERISIAEIYEDVNCNYNFCKLLNSVSTVQGSDTTKLN